MSVSLVSTQDLPNFNQVDRQIPENKIAETTITDGALKPTVEIKIDTQSEPSYDNHENGNDITPSPDDEANRLLDDFTARMINKNEVMEIKSQIIQWESLINETNKEAINQTISNLNHKLNATLDSVIGTVLNMST